MKCCREQADWSVWIGAIMILLFGALDRDRPTNAAPESQQPPLNVPETAEPSFDQSTPETNLDHDSPGQDTTGEIRP